MSKQQYARELIYFLVLISIFLTCASESSSKEEDTSSDSLDEEKNETKVDLKASETKPRNGWGSDEENSDSGSILDNSNGGMDYQLKVTRGVLREQDAYAGGGAAKPVRWGV